VAALLMWHVSLRLRLNLRATKIAWATQIATRNVISVERNDIHVK
jgi:hypothetical protein